MSFRFRDWPVYNDARKFRLAIRNEVLLHIPKVELYELGSQLRRAVTSVVLNIAEGSYRSTDKDFARFLNQAIASCYEVVACLDCCLDDGFIDGALHSKLVEQAENVAKQLSAFCSTLSNQP